MAEAWLEHSQQVDELDEIDLALAALSVAEASIELGKHEAAADHLAAARDVKDLDWMQRLRADSLQAAVLFSQQQCEPKPSPRAKQHDWIE